jgi:hypothetical protein
LQAECWPDPLAAESGNGFHLLYALDLPNESYCSGEYECMLQKLQEVEILPPDRRPID